MAITHCCVPILAGPMTYLVTGAVTGDKSEGTLHRIQRTYAAKGLRVRRINSDKSTLAAAAPPTACVAGHGMEANELASGCISQLYTFQ